MISDKCINRDTKKLEEVENDPTYSNEQKRLYKDYWLLEYWKTGKARNTVTESKRSSDTSCNDQAHPWKVLDKNTS